MPSNKYDVGDVIEISFPEKVFTSFGIPEHDYTYCVAHYGVIEQIDCSLFVRWTEGICWWIEPIDEYISVLYKN